MHVRIVALAAVVAFAPAAVSAQTEQPSSPGRPAEAAPRWTLGAGVSGFSQIVLVGSSSSTSPLVTSVPLATAFVERRVGERSWLVFGGDATASRDTVKTSSGYSAASESYVARTSLSVGLRRLLTRPGAMVDVSLLATLGGGYIRVHAQAEVEVEGGPRTEQDDTGAFANATAGVAVERALTDSLALRISTPLVELYVSRREREYYDGASQEYASAGLSVAIAPRLELRVAF
jgi:hypothetical protein